MDLVAKALRAIEASMVQAGHAGQYALAAELQRDVRRLRTILQTSPAVALELSCLSYSGECPSVRAPIFIYFGRTL